MRKREMREIILSITDILVCFGVGKKNLIGTHDNARNYSGVVALSD